MSKATPTGVTHKDESPVACWHGQFVHMLCASVAIRIQWLLMDPLQSRRHIIFHFAPSLHILHIMLCTIPLRFGTRQHHAVGCTPAPSLRLRLPTPEPIPLMLARVVSTHIQGRTSVTQLSKKWGHFNHVRSIRFIVGTRTDLLTWLVAMPVRIINHCLPPLSDTPTITGGGVTGRSGCHA